MWRIMQEHLWASPGGGEYHSHSHSISRDLVNVPYITEARKGHADYLEPCGKVKYA